MRWSSTLASFLLLGVLLPAVSLAQASGIDPPTITSTGPDVWTQETSAEFTFTHPDSGVSFQCRLNGGSFEPCSGPGSQTYPTLPEGEHTFQVRAVLGEEPDQEQSPPSSRTWRIDITPPSLPQDKTVEATSPLGTPVEFEATDNLDENPVLNDCTAPSGSAFDLGTTQVTCTATDAAGNSSGPDTFNVTVEDTSDPVLSPHDDVTAVQTSKAGSVVTFDPPTVTDNGDPAPAVDCSPASGNTFPIGTTEVTCSAEDASGNESSIQFDVIVQQGAIPKAPLVDSNVGALTRRTNAQFTFSVPDGLTAECQLDAPGDPGSFGPCETASSQTYTGLADGNYLFTLQVTNSIGNVAQTTHAWAVDTLPATAVFRLRSRFGNHWVNLLWDKPTDVDYSHVVIARKRVGGTKWTRLGTRSSGTTLLDKPVPNDVRFEYAVRTIDLAGNRSAASKVLGRASRILSPRYGAVVGSPPLIDWTSVRSATYYNMQLWRDGRKILSVWPGRSSYRLRAGWTFGGRDYSLRQATYRVYVWPGFGAKSSADYGGLLGWTSFTVG